MKGFKGFVGLRAYGFRLKGLGLRASGLKGLSKGFKCLIKRLRAKGV